MIKGKYVFGTGTVILLATSFCMLYTDGLKQFIGGIVCSLPMILMLVVELKYKLLEG